MDYRFFGLRERPFHVTSDPAFFYMGPTHGGACAHLLAAVRAGTGLVALTGEPGTGKTTVLARVTDELISAGVPVLSCHVAQTFDEIAASIWRQLGILAAGDTLPERLARLSARSTPEAGTGDLAVVALDEAQLLGPDLLRDLRALADSGPARGIRLVFLLVGHTDLDATLAMLKASGGPGFAARVVLEPLSAEEIVPYVHTRLHRAGAERTDVLAPDALARVARYAEGLPRLINQLCDTALKLAHDAGQSAVSSAMIDEAAAVLDLLPAGRAPLLPRADGGGDRGPWRVRSLRFGWAELAWAGAILLLLLTRTSHLTPPTVAPRASFRATAAASGPLASPDSPLVSPSGSTSRVAAPVAADALLARTAAVSLGLEPGAKPERRPATSAATGGRSYRIAARAPSPEEQALLAGAEAGHLDAVTALLGAGVSPDATDNAGITPLMVAVIHGHAEIARALLDHGAQVDAADRAGFTPLMMAVNNGRAELLESLLDRGAAVNARTHAGWTALMYAAWQGRADLARRLLAAGADPTATDAMGWTARMYATWRTASPTRIGPAPQDLVDPSARGDRPPASTRGFSDVITLLGTDRAAALDARPLARPAGSPGGAWQR